MEQVTVEMSADEHDAYRSLQECAVRLADAEERYFAARDKDGVSATAVEAAEQLCGCVKIEVATWQGRLVNAIVENERQLQSSRGGNCE